jgi:hypothetical protein
MALDVVGAAGATGVGFWPLPPGPVMPGGLLPMYGLPGPGFDAFGPVAIFGSGDAAAAVMFACKAAAALGFTAADVGIGAALTALAVGSCVAPWPGASMAAAGIVGVGNARVCFTGGAGAGMGAAAARGGGVLGLKPRAGAWTGGAACTVLGVMGAAEARPGRGVGLGMMDLPPPILGLPADGAAFGTGAKCDWRDDGRFGACGLGGVIMVAPPCTMARASTVDAPPRAMGPEGWGAGARGGATPAGADGACGTG